MFKEISVTWHTKRKEIHVIISSGLNDSVCYLLKHCFARGRVLEILPPPFLCSFAMVSCDLTAAPTWFVQLQRIYPSQFCVSLHLMSPAKKQTVPTQPCITNTNTASMSSPGQLLVREVPLDSTAHSSHFNLTTSLKGSWQSTGEESSSLYFKMLSKTLSLGFWSSWVFRRHCLNI